MSEPIADYGLIGDTHTTALVSRGGSIDWLCWPRHDSPALFLRLLDDERGGHCSVHFKSLLEVTRRYLPQTNLLETRFRTRDGVAVLTDFMPVRSPEATRDEGPDSEGESRLIRVLHCVEGRVAGRFDVRPTFDYARVTCEPRLCGDGSALFQAGNVRVRVTASETLHVQPGAVAVKFDLESGQRACLILAHGDDSTPAGKECEGALSRLQATRHFWESWSARCRYTGPYREAVLRSALCLKLLTYAPTGAIIAAPTMGLPEAIPGNRNYDYRYAWLRDASFTVTSFASLGYVREAAEYLRFLHHADPSHGRSLSLVYGIDDPVPDETPLRHLSGWRGVGPVSVGNSAATQRQHDIYGEFLLGLHTFLEAVDFKPHATLSAQLPELIGRLADKALSVRDEPDHGIWEPRTAPQQMFHTKALLWVALDRAAKIARRLGGIDRDRIGNWERTAQAIRDDYHERGWNPERGAFTQAYGSDVLDAAVLRTVLFGALDPTDPRLLATYDAISRELGAGVLLYRYRADDGMQGHEATFTACAFWQVGCLAMGGRKAEAAERFETLLGYGNDLGLFAEQIDAATGEQRGNFPQAFTHMAIINHAMRIQRA